MNDTYVYYVYECFTCGRRVLEEMYIVDDKKVCHECQKVMEYVGSRTIKANKVMPFISVNDEVEQDEVEEVEANEEERERIIREFRKSELSKQHLILKADMRDQQAHIVRLQKESDSAMQMIDSLVQSKSGNKQIVDAMADIITNNDRKILERHQIFMNKKHRDLELLLELYKLSTDEK
jgi:DNA-directed RNA polymerase subunit RPC12/RpoP